MNKIGDEIVDFGNTHPRGMAFVVVKDKLSHPREVRLFNAERIVSVAEDFAVLVVQVLFFSRRR